MSENRKLELMAVVVDTVTGSKDILAWGGTADGRFMVSSAYKLLTQDDIPRQNMESFFNRIWRVVALERIRVFIWLVAQ